MKIEISHFTFDCEIQEIVFVTSQTSIGRRVEFFTQQIRRVFCTNCRVQPVPWITFGTNSWERMLITICNISFITEVPFFNVIILANGANSIISIDFTSEDRRSHIFTNLIFQIRSGVAGQTVIFVGQISHTFCNRGDSFTFICIRSVHPEVNQTSFTFI